MVQKCSAHCGSVKKAGDGVIFHNFPLKEEEKEILKKWLVALRRPGFTPTIHSRICSLHFLPEDYFPFSKSLLSTSVPSVFPEYPTHLQKIHRRRKLPTEREPPPSSHGAKKQKLTAAAADSSTSEATPSEVTTSEATTSEASSSSKPSRKASPTKEDLQLELKSKKNKIKILQQKVRRKNEKVKTLTTALDEANKKNLLHEDAVRKIKNNFPGMDGEVIANHLTNKERIPQGRRHSDEVKKFSLTLNFYSPKAYDFLRNIFSLPHPSSLANWTSTIDCEPGFFLDVFEALAQKVEGDVTTRDCALLCDAMSIMSGVMYRKSTGTFEGFINYGSDIVSFDEDTVATEALVFMLVGLRSLWKFPVGFVLTDKIDGHDLHCLLSQCLNHSAKHGLIVHMVTMDGAPSNFLAMKRFGCKMGSVVKNIDGRFKVSCYPHVLYFYPDPPHMLKLARNALADLGVFRIGESLIEWKFIANLHEVQLDEGLKFGNKLGSGHIEYQRHKMNVRVAAQTFSNSVADAIEFLMINDHPLFQGANATVKFIRMLDRMFDLLNSKNFHSSGYYKKPLMLNIRTPIRGCAQSTKVSLTWKSCVPLKDSDYSNIDEKRLCWVLSLH